jgi:hypothetical protein
MELELKALGQLKRAAEQALSLAAGHDEHRLLSEGERLAGDQEDRIRPFQLIQAVLGEYRVRRRTASQLQAKTGSPM